MVDDRGFTTELIEKPIELWQEGVYNLRYSFYPDVTDPEAVADLGTGVGNVEMHFYVLGNHRENKFDWNIKSGSTIELDQSLYLASEFPENAYKEGTIHYSVSFNGELIAEELSEFTGNGFEISINIPKMLEDIPNLSMDDPYDVIEICSFVKGVNLKGKNKYMANRSVVRSSRIEY